MRHSSYIAQRLFWYYINKCCCWERCLSHSTKAIYISYEELTNQDTLDRSIEPKLRGARQFDAIAFFAPFGNSFSREELSWFILSRNFWISQEILESDMGKTCMISLFFFFFLADYYFLWHGILRIYVSNIALKFALLIWVRWYVCSQIEWVHSDTSPRCSPSAWRYIVELGHGWCTFGIFVEVIDCNSI